MLSTIISNAVGAFGIILVLMLIDFVTGLLKATKNHTKIESHRLRSSINKAIIYFIVLLIGGCLSVFGEAVIGEIFKVFLCLVEGVSITENLMEMFPESKMLGKIKHLLNKEIDKKTE